MNERSNRQINNEPEKGSDELHFHLHHKKYCPLTTENLQRLIFDNNLEIPNIERNEPS